MSYLGHDDDRVGTRPGRQVGEELVEVGGAGGQDHLGEGWQGEGSTGDRLQERFESMEVNWTVLLSTI